jgi:mono/diheme cytochrome c family protein
LQIEDCRLQIRQCLIGSVSGVLSVRGLCKPDEAGGPAAKPAAPAVKATPASIANGETLYKRQCQMCHGATAWATAPPRTLKGKLPNFTDKAAMAKIKDEEIHEAVENGLKTEIGQHAGVQGQDEAGRDSRNVMNFVSHSEKIQSRLK